MLKNDQRINVKLDSENSERLKRLQAQAPILSVNKVANAIIALSLHLYESNANRLFGKPKAK